MIARAGWLVAIALLMIAPWALLAIASHWLAGIPASAAQLLCLLWGLFCGALFTAALMMSASGTITRNDS